MLECLQSERIWISCWMMLKSSPDERGKERGNNGRGEGGREERERERERWEEEREGGRDRRERRRERERGVGRTDRPGSILIIFRATSSLSLLFTFACGKNDELITKQFCLQSHNHRSHPIT